MKTSVFEEHLKYLKDNGYKVIPLRQLVNWYQKKGPAPAPKSVVIVEDAFCRSRVGPGDPLQAGVRVGGTLYRIIGVTRDLRPDGEGVSCTVCHQISAARFGGGKRGIALDVLIGVLILGVFMFQIREQFDSLDLHHLEALKEET